MYVLGIYEVANLKVFALFQFQRKNWVFILSLHAKIKFKVEFHSSMSPKDQ